MIAAIHQPQFLPWLGYIDKIARSDVFVFLDDAQYKKNEWINRNRIKAASGGQWLTVPVSFHFGDKINEVKIDSSSDWRKKLRHALTVNYGRSRYFAQYAEKIFAVINGAEHALLSGLNMALVEVLLESAGLRKKIVRTSEMNIASTSTARLVEICKKLGADTYLSGQGAREYLERGAFADAGLRLVFQEFVHPRYNQLYGDFLPNLSMVDLLFNEGPKSFELLRGAA